MFSNCLFLLFFSIFIDAHIYTYSCVLPRLEHGRVRGRQRSRLVKFMCLPRYELVGNRYATCRNGEWDVPMPVCVKPGCEQFSVPNAVQIKGHHDAWVVTLCMPGYRLVGSSAIYCNGLRWNDTSPACVDTPLSPSLSCDFERADICGWIQDELHDFDWKRINTKTPSSFLATGPSYDHTLGIGKGGFYMYIESTSKLENNTARLLSPIYDSHLSLSGCFSFFYHMYGRGTGGLRIYQKPDSVQMSDLLNMADSDKDIYLLWEQWGNLGDFWYSAAPQLKYFNDSFQIVIEGVRGKSFTSDIAIDDVALLQGKNCTNFRLAATTPAPPPSELTCQDRCETSPSPATSSAACECHPGCTEDDRCCPDYFELCAFKFNTTSDDDNSTPAEQPQTQKLIGETTTTTTQKPTTSTQKPTTLTTTPKPTTKTTTLKTIPLTTKPTTPKTYPPTTRTPTINVTEIKPTTTQKTTIKTTSKPTVRLTTVKITPIYAQLTTIGTKKLTIPNQYTTVTPQTLKSITIMPSSTIKTTPNLSKMEKQEEKKRGKETNLQQTVEKTREITQKSSSMKTAVVTIVILAALAGLTYLAVMSRTARGREAIARLRGRVSADRSEVRYLNSNDDDL